MHTANQSLFTRDDTFFGVCEAIGEDFGFDAMWLRMGLAVAFLLNPPAVIVLYAALGALVLVSRWVFPATKPAPTVDAKPLEADNDAAPVPFAEAA